MDYFHDMYDSSLDDKNRLIIPAKFRKIMTQSEQTTFVISTIEDECLTLYPKETFRKKIAAKIEELPETDDDANELRRAIGIHTTEVNLDNQGRIVIPANFREFATIKKEVKLIGMMSKFEVWNPEIFTRKGKTSDRNSIKRELKKHKI